MGSHIQAQQCTRATDQTILKLDNSDRILAILMAEIPRVKEYASVLKMKIKSIIIIVCTVACFCAAPLFSGLLPHYMVSSQTSSFLSAWWSFGMFLVAIIAAIVGWNEYKESSRPQIILGFHKSFRWCNSLQNDGSTQKILEQDVSLTVRNIGKNNAFQVNISFKPGIPWPLASRPAGETQDQLMHRNLSCLPVGESINLLLAERSGFDAVIDDPAVRTQSIQLTYEDISHHHYRQCFTLDLHDIWYLQSQDRR